MLRGDYAAAGGNNRFADDMGITEVAGHEFSRVVWAAKCGDPFIEANGGLPVQEILKLDRAGSYKFFYGNRSHIYCR